MELKKLFLERLEAETTATRKVIERVPEGHNDWKPHEKSMPLGYLAALVASMPGWVSFMIETDGIDFTDPSSEGFKTKAVQSRAELLQLLEKGSTDSRKSLEKTTDEHLMKPWAFKMGGKAVSEGPRYTMILDGVLGHLAHHRGQLTVYLRLNDAAVPAIYGPTADEKF
jgi:uncharacterized damage-inducible protein DinB